MRRCLRGDAYASTTLRERLRRVDVESDDVTRQAKESDMSEAIGSMLSRLGMPAQRPEPLAPRTAVGAPSAGSFGAALETSFRERATRLGLELPAATPLCLNVAGNQAFVRWHASQDCVVGR